MQKTMMMLAMVGLMMSCQQGPKVTEWVTTSYDAPWQINATTQLTDAVSDSLVIIDSTKTLQTIEGFGTCFNELGWSSLSELAMMKYKISCMSFSSLAREPILQWGVCH